MTTTEEKVDRIMKLLKEKGYKYTDKRKSMVKLLVTEDRYINAKFVSETLGKVYPGLSFDTIYRNLSTYEELGILETTEIKGEKYFKIGCLEEDHHHHHHICLGCGKAKIIHIHVCDNLQIDELKGYRIDGHKFEVYGLCPKCSEKEENK